MFKITKLKAVENPRCRTADTHDEYRKSVVDSLFRLNDDHLSPSIDYWVIGDIIRWPEVGQTVLMDRKIRNGVIVEGMFETTIVTELILGGFKTLNSEYIIEGVDEDAL